MDLILWRHCDAAPGVPDESRPLTPLGAVQAVRIANWLATRLPHDCRIVASPALRAQQTARALGRAFETDGRLASGADPEAVLAAAGWPDENATVVVAHQPTLGEVASLLVDGEPRERPMRTGEVLWLASVGDDGRATLAHVLAPQ
ncbi:MAG TPA: histidine phosphatase family protein [Casimicrobiaceae bacterium]|nr:histidine phosphatase family protein [Casimicrobiaceae bacterium]